jgi:hypothetical protein
VGSKWEKGEKVLQDSPHEVAVSPQDLGLRFDSQGQVAIVVFDPHLMAFNTSPTFVHKLPLRRDKELEYFVLTQEQAFHYGTHTFGITTN